MSERQAGGVLFLGSATVKRVSPPDDVAVMLPSCARAIGRTMKTPSPRLVRSPSGARHDDAAARTASRACAGESRVGGARGGREERGGGRGQGGGGRGQGGGSGLGTVGLGTRSDPAAPGDG